MIFEDFLMKQSIINNFFKNRLFHFKFDLILIHFSMETVPKRVLKISLKLIFLFELQNVLQLLPLVSWLRDILRILHIEMDQD